MYLTVSDFPQSSSYVQKSHSLFLWLLGQMLTDFYNIWQYCSWENLQTKNLFISYNIQCMNITE